MTVLHASQRLFKRLSFMAQFVLGDFLALYGSEAVRAIIVKKIRVWAHDEDVQTSIGLRLQDTAHVRA